MPIPNTSAKTLINCVLDVGSGHLSSRYARGHVNIDLVKPPDFPDIFIQCDAHYLPFHDNTFRKVIFYDVIEHVENPSQCLREIYRVLRPHGHVVISTPNPLHFRNAFSALRGKPLQLSSSTHIATWTNTEITILLTNIGFRTIHVDYTILPATKLYDSRKHRIIDNILFHLFPRSISGRSMIIHAWKG